MFTIIFKKTVKITGIILILFIIHTPGQFIQGQTTANLNAIEEYLTNEQKQMLQEERELIKQHRHQFRKMLSQDQLNILSDESLSDEQKRERLRKTFTKEQKEILNEHARRLEQKRKEFRSSLTNEQKLKIREQYQHREHRNQSNDKMNGAKDRSGKHDINQKGNKGGR